MKRSETKIALLVIVLIAGILSGCSNIKKLYRKGEVNQTDFFAKIPFERKLELMIIPVEINGQTYQFLFDTGAPSVISPEVFQNLNKKSLGKQRAGDSQGQSQELEFVVIDSLKIGDINFTNTAALVADLNAAIEISCLNIDGIIGANLMRLAYWKIDPMEKAMYCASDISALTGDLQDPVSLTFRPSVAFKPMISISLDGELNDGFLLDTGAGTYLAMGTDLLKKENILAKYHGLGSTGLYGATVDTIWIGKTELGIDAFSQKCEAICKSGPAKRIVGMDFMKQFIFILNWEESRVDFYPQNVEQQYFSMFDAVPRWKDDQLSVGTMRLDTADFSEGLQIGDTILEVNERVFTKGNSQDYCDWILERDTRLDDTLKLKISDGRIFALPRKKYAIQ